MKTLCAAMAVSIGASLLAGCGGGGSGSSPSGGGGTPTGIPAAYTLTDLGVLPTGQSAVPNGCNAVGTVVGFADDVVVGFTKAVKWQNGGISPIGPTAHFSSAQAIDPTGTYIVGQNQMNAGDPVHAALFTGSSVTDLTPTATGQTFARGVNSSGQVVGYAEGGTAFLWTSSNLQVLGVTGSIATGINDAGTVVGSSPVGAKAHATLWQNGSPTDLGTLPGGSGGQSVALAINSSGQIVGSSDCTAGTHAFVYDHGVMTDLGSLSGKSSALAINDSGFIVGDYAITTFSVKPCIWYNGQAKDLNALVTGNPSITVEQPVGIAANGVIAATAVVDGKNHAILLTPAG